MYDYCLQVDDNSLDLNYVFFLWGAAAKIRNLNKTCLYEA